ncbi:unnamed protein product [Caenorhabditis angaria]|uniref:Uncharacterized protein n=1 Tax=Caenorhabditis angaria TaxID=860376 RepID=A0A9P1J4G5_9PELO|nr:unnamed protein product [Caenorhabditis angaria]
MLNNTCREQVWDASNRDGRHSIPPECLGCQQLRKSHAPLQKQKKKKKQNVVLLAQHDEKREKKKKEEEKSSRPSSSSTRPGGDGRGHGKKEQFAINIRRQALTHPPLLPMSLLLASFFAPFFAFVFLNIPAFFIFLEMLFMFPNILYD